jgi:hypothetical protein
VIAARDELSAGAGLAAQQDRTEVGDAIDVIPEVGDRVAVPDEAVRDCGAAR